jgi:hypothetical protein
MGIGITGISKAKLVPCSGDYVEGEYGVCLEAHYTVDAPSRGRDRVKPGCYVGTISRHIIRSGEFPPIVGQDSNLVMVRSIET